MLDTIELMDASMATEEISITFPQGDFIRSEADVYLDCDRRIDDTGEDNGTISTVTAILRSKNHPQKEFLIVSELHDTVAKFPRYLFNKEIVISILKQGRTFIKVQNTQEYLRRRDESNKLDFTLSKVELKNICDALPIDKRESVQFVALAKELERS